MIASKKVYKIVDSLNDAERKAMVDIDLESRNLKSSRGSLLNKNNLSYSKMTIDKINTYSSKEISKKMRQKGTVYATGRRKAAVAKVWVTKGNGEVIINKQTMEEWFKGHEELEFKVKVPLDLMKTMFGTVSIKATTVGGGYIDQVNALKNGISKALVAYEPSCKKLFKSKGLLDKSHNIDYKKSSRKKAKIFNSFHIS